LAIIKIKLTKPNLIWISNIKLQWKKLNTFKDKFVDKPIHNISALRVNFFKIFVNNAEEAGGGGGG